MNGQDIITQSSKDVRQAARLLADLLELAGIETQVEYDGPEHATHVATVSSLERTDLYAELHINGSAIVWCHRVSRSYPDLIDVAVAFKRLLAGGR